MDMSELYDRQNEIIRLQSDIIDDLFLQVLQYVTVEEEEKELAMIKEAVSLQREVTE